MKTQPRRLRLTRPKVLALADLYRRQSGRNPTQRSGPVQPGWRLTWKAVETGLREGYYGLPGGESLAQLLAEHRGIRNRSQLPRLTIAQILLWAEAHFRRTGYWPTAQSGLVFEAPGETWEALNSALRKGCRGLPGGTTLRRAICLYRNLLLDATSETPLSDVSKGPLAQDAERILIRWRHESDLVAAR